jgi:hypothetical protein
MQAIIMQAEEIGEIEGCYEYMHKEIRHRGLFVNSLEGNCRIVPLEETTIYEGQFNDPDFEANQTLQVAIKHLPLLVANFRDLVTKLSRENLVTKKSIYCVGLSHILRRELMFRAGMENIFGIRYSMFFTSDCYPFRLVSGGWL